MILQNSSQLTYIPQRIISLVPSQTELLYHLNLDAVTVGISKFCVHPPHWFKTKTKVGGTKTVNLGLVNQLQPDLIIANKEENIKEQVEALAKDFPVWLTDVNDLEDALQMISDIGALTNTNDKALPLLYNIKNAFGDLRKPREEIRTAYLIWQNPYMTVGRDTFIHDMLTRCGFRNIFADETRYPQIDIAQLRSASCELLLLSSEPFPFKQKHVDELQLELPKTRIMLVDGEYFSWYGSRLLQAPAYFKSVLNKLVLLN